jgi:hypothetical protein
MKPYPYVDTNFRSVELQARNHMWRRNVRARQLRRQTQPRPQMATMVQHFRSREMVLFGQYSPSIWCDIPSRGHVVAYWHVCSICPQLCHTYDCMSPLFWFELYALWAQMLPTSASSDLKLFCEYNRDTDTRLFLGRPPHLPCLAFWYAMPARWQKNVWRGSFSQSQTEAYWGKPRIQRSGSSPCSKNR